MSRIDLHISLMTMAVATAMTAMTACSESYPGLNYERPVNIGNNEAENPTPVQVYLEEQRFFEVNPQTKGVGPLENEDAETGERPEGSADEQLFTFRVFGFLNDGDFGAPDLSYSFFSQEGTGGRDTRHRQCLVDGYEYNGQGMAAKLNPDKSKELIFQYDDEKCDGEPYRFVYSGSTDEELRRGYNFFVYHIDDCETTTTRNADRIKHEIVINGTQDIMAGASPVLDDKYLETHFAETKRALTQEELTMIRNIRGFSSYTAHRGIYPIVQLEHKMARLRFFVYPGATKDANGDPVTCKGIFIDKISINLPNKGDFTVAGHTPDDIALTWRDAKSTEKDEKGNDIIKYTEGGDVFLCRRMITPDSLTTEHLKDSTLLVGKEESTKEGENGKIESGVGWHEWNDQWNNTPWKQRPRLTLGRDMLIPPVDECTMTVYYHIENEWSNAKDSPDQLGAHKMMFHLPPSDINTTFEAGKIYNINIAIYGPQKIEVNANIDNWQFGGNINVGNEDE